MVHSRKIPTHLFDGTQHSLKTFRSAYGRLSRQHPDLLPPVTKRSQRKLVHPAKHKLISDIKTCKIKKHKSNLPIL